MATGNLPTDDGGKAFLGALYDNSGSNELQAIKGYSTESQNSEDVAHLGVQLPEGQSFAKEIVVDANVQTTINGSTAVHYFTAALADLGNPTAIVVKLELVGGTDSVNQALDIQLRMTQVQQANKRFFFEAALFPASTNGAILILGPQTGSANGQNVIFRNVPLLQFFPANTDLEILIYNSSSAPTVTGQLKLTVTAFY